MGNLTPSAGVWYPDEEDKMEINTLMGTMASSIENGLGERMNLQETFTGCNLRITNSPSYYEYSSSTNLAIVPFGVIADSVSFISDDMSVTGGRITVPYSGIYQINFLANFTATSNTRPRINTYIFANGSSIAYSSAYGEPMGTISPYTNCNVNGVFKLMAGTVVDVRLTILDAGARLWVTQGSGVSIALVSRAK